MEKPIPMSSCQHNTSNNTVYIMIIIIILLFSGAFDFLSNNQTIENSEYIKKEMSEIKQSINKYESENKKLTSKVLYYEKILLKIDSSISVNEKKIDNIKSSTNEKINSFKSYDARMWEKFFADRYAE